MALFRRNSYIALILAALVGLNIYFVNCAEGLPDNLESNSSSTPQTLTISFSPQSFNVGESAQTFVSGGTAPYSYLVTRGSGMVSDSGLVRSDYATAMIVQVEDSLGRTSLGSISVYLAGAPLGPNCRTSWGQFVPNGGQILGFASSSVNCPTTCREDLLVCSNGVLSGTGGFNTTAGSCSVASCVYKKESSYACVSSSYAGVTAVPTICPVNDYHAHKCIYDNSLSEYSEYYCASASETVSVVDRHPAPDSGGGGGGTTGWGGD